MTASRTLRLALLASLVSCAAALPPVPTIEGTTFASSLNVQLSQSTRLPSGTYYRDLVPGTGAAVAAGKMVSANYTGWLADGTQFGSNAGAAGFQFLDGASPQQVISGWDIGLVGAQVGGTRQLIIPPDQGYGANGQYDQQGNLVIPANSILVFTVQIDSVQ